MSSQVAPHSSQSSQQERKNIFHITKIKNKKIWTEEEDKELIFYTNLYKERCWEEISKHFPNKTGLQCFSRFNRIRPGLSRGKWTKEEDDKIIELVRLYGRAWSIIARMFQSRNGKQIRDRYINVLDPSINKAKFTEEEDKLLTELYKRKGPKWSEISKYFPNRTTDMIKNRFHSSIKCKLFCQDLIKKSRETKYLLKKQKINDSITINDNFDSNNTETEEEEISIDINQIYHKCDCMKKDFMLSSCSDTDNSKYCTNCSSPEHCCCDRSDNLFFDSL